MRRFLDFEKPIADLDGKIADLRHLAESDGVNIGEEVRRLQAKSEKLLRSTYAKLTAWQKTQVARHQDRPHLTDYLDTLITDFTPLAGDRLYGEDRAVVGGMGRFHGRAVMVMGQEKGSDMESRVRHNFGMARPEGYRKAQRLMKLAERFALPLIAFVDTAGAYPGIGAEERGQAEAIARCLDISLSLKVPVVAAVIGEGGSGGAIALAAADRVLMLEHSIYSVISPEGCASILWRSAKQNKEAAEALRLTAQDLERLRVIDEVLTEPLGGAHRSPLEAIAAVDAALKRCLDILAGKSPEQLVSDRRQKFLAMGKVGLG
ncbi:MAG: acetyl-CoA carboxylase carboxyltransferase subunit alpha [Rhodospirillales bacterium]|nr:acetyl-CoA carboxylase carboxyltransferase subunit alpha [Rhodospirillales bacterium]